MIGVACAAQTRGWTGLPSVLAPCLRRRWPAGPPPSARPHAALSRVGQAVALWGLHNGTSQHLPQPSPPMAGALGRWGMRAWTARLACTAPIQGMARPHAGRAGRLGPCPHAPQTRGKRPCARGVRRLPPPRVWPGATASPRVGVARARLGRNAWSTPRRTGLWGPRACHAPGGAGPPAVWTVSGAAAAATAGAALAHTPSALSQALGEAAGATAAPTLPPGAAGGARAPRAPGHPLGCSAAPRAWGPGAGGGTVVPTRRQRPRPWARRSQASAAWPTPCALAPQGPGQRRTPNAGATSGGRPVLDGRTKAGALGQTRRPCARRLRRPRRGGVLEGAVTPQHASPQGHASGTHAAHAPARASRRSVAEARAVRQRADADAARGKRIVRSPVWGGWAPVVRPASRCAEEVGASTLPSRQRGRHATPLQTINRIRYNQTSGSSGTYGTPGISAWQ